VNEQESAAESNSSCQPSTLMTLDPSSYEPAPVIAACSASGTVEDATRAEKRGLLRSGWALFKRLTQIGLPPRFPIVQFPNAPLIFAFLAGAVATHIHGASRSYATAAAFLAMTVWAYEELARGVNWFRRLLGATYMIVMIVRVAHGLQA
jgi:hypothetical protein